MLVKGAKAHWHGPMRSQRNIFALITVPPRRRQWYYRRHAARYLVIIRAPMLWAIGPNINRAEYDDLTFNPASLNPKVATMPSTRWFLFDLDLCLRGGTLLKRNVDRNSGV
jgi:hypothetical protein